MKISLIVICLTLIASNTVARTNEVWNAYWNSDTSKFGFKDANGMVRIEPKFEPFCIAQKFQDNIMAAEHAGNNYKIYYLNKSGKVFGFETSNCEIRLTSINEQLLKNLAGRQ